MRYIKVSSKEEKGLKVLGFQEEKSGTSVIYVKDSMWGQAVIYCAELSDGKRSFILEYTDKKAKEHNLVFTNFETLVSKINNLYI